MREICILNYHRINEELDDYNFTNVDPKNFIEHMRFLKTNYDLISINDINMGSAWQGDRNAVIITFDDGYEDVYLRALPILCDYDIPATCFISTENIDSGEENWTDQIVRGVFQPNKYNDNFGFSYQDLNCNWPADSLENRIKLYSCIRRTYRQCNKHQKKMLRNKVLEWAGLPLKARESRRIMNRDEILNLSTVKGLTIGGHTVTHPYLSFLDSNELKWEVQASKNTIEEIIHNDISIFAYPFGDYSNKVIEAVKEAGYQMAVTSDRKKVTGSCDVMRIPRYSVRNFDKEGFNYFMDSIFSCDTDMLIAVSDSNPISKQIDHPFFSIVMPIYNTGSFLPDSIGSILNQTYKDFELILVDDNSSDLETQNIIRDYKGSDYRVKLLSLEKHVGPANARNIGLKEAQGEYMFFLDSDDYFDSELLEKCYRRISDTQADVVIYNYGHCVSDEIYLDFWAGRSDLFYERFAYQPFEIRKKPFDELLTHVATCNKVIKKELLLDNMIVFQDIPRHNDNYYSIIALLMAKRVIFLNDDKWLVHARDHDSDFRVTNQNAPFSYYDVVIAVLKKLKENGCLSQTIAILSKQICIRLIEGIYECKSETQIRTMMEYISKEGVDRIYSICGETLELADNCLKGLKDAFSAPYELCWWNRDVWLWTLNFEGNNELKEALVHRINARKHIGIWGLGKRGLYLLYWCEHNGCFIDEIFDSNEDLQGKTIQGHIVKSPHSIEFCCDLIITVNPSIYESNSKWIEGVGKELFLLVVN